MNISNDGRKRLLSRREFVELGTASVAALAFGGTGAALAQRGGRGPRYVVLVDWDGFDPDYLDRVPTPNLGPVPT